MIIKTDIEARRLARMDAVDRARRYLENGAPNTLPAIEYWGLVKKWDYEQIMTEFIEIYGETEEKTMHKIRLVVEAVISERDEG